MKKEIFFDPEYNKELAICLHKMTNDNKSFAALRKARSKAFITQYMAEPGWKWKFKEKDMKSAADLLFPEWLKTVDVRDYFVDSKLLNDLLEEMSASEIKLVLVDEMKIYYDAFRENVTCSAFEEETNKEKTKKENADYDGDCCEKFKSDKTHKSFIDIMDEIAHDHHGEEDEDEDDDDDLDEDFDEDNEEDDDLEKFIDALNEDGDLEELINAAVKGLKKFSESLSKKEGKKKNENKSN